MTQQSGPALIEVAGLSKSYGETLALDHATLCFRRGSIHAILGENGSGKSTLVKLLSGVVAPTGGSVHVDGQTPSRFEPTVMQALGVETVFQEVLLAPDRSVTDNILLGADRLFRRRIPRNERRTRAAAALARVSASVVDMSCEAGGLPLAVQQLVVLARALVREPRVLILDEVTAALDFGDREAVFATMEAFAKGGGLILFISHRMDEVKRLASAVTVLRGGRVVETLQHGSIEPERLLRLMAPAAAAELLDAC